MKTKKSPKADLKKKRLLFFEIGLLLSLAICLYAFEWDSKDVGKETLGAFSEGDGIEFEIPITIPEPPKPEPEPEPEPANANIELTVVEDDKEIENVFEFPDEDLSKPVSPIISNSFNLEPEPVEKPVDFVLVEEKPLFPGGDVELFKYLMSNTKYPENAKRMHIEGKIYVKFIISSTGKVEDAEVVRGADPSLNEEALRVVKTIPDWTPGKQRGKAVPVSYIVPITFKLI